MTVLRHPNNQGVTLSQWRKTAAGGETSLSGTDDFSAALAYTAGAEQVFVNGVLLERGVDYTASTGTTVTGLTALVAGDIVTVSSPSAFQVANAIPKSIVTAKGDHIVATGASTVTNLPVGADGTTLVANSSSATGMSWAGPTFAAGKNKIINGDFGIWQRGTSFTPTNGGFIYTTDRWYAVRSAGTTNLTISQNTSLPTGLAGYSVKFQRTAGDTQTATNYFIQALETNTSIPLTGMPVTLSFWAKAGANYSGGAATAVVTTGTGTNQGGYPTGWTGTANAIVSTFTPTTSWIRYSFTGTTSSSATQIASWFYYATTGTAGADDSVYFAGVQLEAGSVATPFTTATGTLQGELAACQRYYYRSSATPYGGANFLAPMGAFNSSTNFSIPFMAPVPMRAVPSSVIDFSTLWVTDFASNFSVTAITLDSNSTSNCVFLNGTIASGATQFRPAMLRANASSSAYIGFTAEL
jgi:hypothetical protein